MNTTNRSTTQSDVNVDSNSTVESVPKPDFSKIGLYKDVNAVLQRYFEALYEASAPMIEELFHPSAIYATADQEPTLIRDLPTYLQVMEMRESPKSRNEVRRDYIASIEFAGDNTALAKVGCSIAGNEFVDFLTLIREQDEWRIIAKVFQISKQ